MIEYLRAGTVKRIHVNRFILRENYQRGLNNPAVTVQTSKGSHRCIRATVLGPSEMEQAGVFRRDTDGSKYTVRPLSCGARVWLKTRAAVEVVT